MSVPELELPSGRQVRVDEKGYLLNWKDWSREVAKTMATADGTRLEPDHWTLFQAYREYFEKYDIEPPMRALVRFARERLGADKGSSLYLYQLFPDGPGTQGVRYAGLPRPVSCV
jgi:tRNA 2-thiouridine synthesizing protein E